MIVSHRINVLKDDSDKDCFAPYTVKDIDLSKTGDKKILMRWIASTLKNPPRVFSGLRRYREGEKRHFEEWYFNNMEFSSCAISRGVIERLTFRYLGFEWRTNPYRESAD